NPPLAETREMVPSAEPAKRIVPSRFHVPPRPLLLTPPQIVVTVPDASSTRRSAVVVKNAIERPSGDQNGMMPPSVPAIGRASSAPSGRSKRGSAPPSGLIATLRPSGETLAKTRPWTAASGRARRKRVTPPDDTDLVGENARSAMSVAT